MRCTIEAIPFLSLKIQEFFLKIEVCVLGNVTGLTDDLFLYL